MSKPQDLDLSDGAIAGILKRLDGSYIIGRDESGRTYNTLRDAFSIITTLAEQRKSLLAMEERLKENLWDLEHQTMKTASEIFCERRLRIILGVKL